jgi:dolichyl-phosphate-mannose-protein mannosyltransferase
MTTPDAISPISNRRPGRREWGLVLLIVLIGFVLRFAFPERMAVEHFDEGIYASNLWFDAEQRFRYPARYLYAPPLVPGLLEWSQVLWGPTHLGTMLVGVLSGTFTIGLVWWVVRTWFGVSAGLAAAMFAAISDYHLLFSRTALTEPVLCLLLLASVYLLWLAVVKLNHRWAVAGGLCTGLCWSAKYNGWLPIAIGAAAISTWAIFPRTKTPERGRRFLLLAVVAVFALLVVSPVWWDLQAEGGYRVVQENHARYLVGLSGWGTAFQRQLANHRAVDSPLSWLGLGLAVVLAGASSHLGEKTSTTEGSGRRNWLWVLCWAIVLMILGWWQGTSLALGLLGSFWLIAACPWWNRTQPTESPAKDLAYWLIAVWFVGLFLVTPFYTPYPRLSLPWLISAWITAGAMIGSPTGQQLLFGTRPWQSAHNGIPIVVWLGFAFLLGLAGNVVVDKMRSPAGWEDRTGLERAARQIQKRVQAEYQGQAVVYVYAEPALFYHLRANDLPIVAPVADLGFVDRSSPVPVLLAVGLHAERSPSFQADFERRASQMELLESFSYTPSELVLLDHFPPAALRDPAFPREQTVKLYRLQSP